ncbi:MAG: methylmalonyl-CoA mutase family protein [Dehalococcoidia bacterium]|nr:methylmalonyl-CoA mutase family protein [Dehalococcoidia bacterium]
MSDEVTTDSGIPLKRIYRPEDVASLDYDVHLGDSGSYPYTRGIHPEMFRRRPWIMRVLAGEGTPRQTNVRLRKLLAAGQTGIDVIGDSPTMSWLDSDHPLAAASVGTQGVPLCCLDDYRELLEGIPLDAVSLSWSAPAPFVVAALTCLAEERGTPTDAVRGSTIVVPLYCEDCSYATGHPVEMRMRLAVDAIEFSAQRLPNFHAFVEDAYYISEVGLNAVEELALALVEARAIIRALLSRGVPIDSFGHRIAFLLTARMDFFEEIAKYRALRRIWARMMRDEFGAQDPRSWRLTITVHTSGISLTASQLPNNIVRGAYEALAAVLGGCQAVEVCAFDEPFRVPTLEAATVALRTLQIIAYETGVTRVADPLGGSYYVETLTNELEERVLALVRDIEAKGDVLELARTGYFASVFHRAISRRHEALRTGIKKVVGVNVLVMPPEEDTLLRDLAETRFEVAQEQIEKVRELRRRRDQAKVRAALAHVASTAREPSANLVFPIMEALKVGATMGEIAGAVRTAYQAPYSPLEERLLAL